jgi:ATP-dependent Lon protease
MYRIPVFPLSVVLFPDASLPLHIFEPRYRRMVARCLEYDRRFGIVYHDSDIHGPFLMEEGRVGTIAEIQDFQPLPDGRSLIATRGRDRFRIRDGIESDEPFYEAVAETFEDREAEGEEIVRRRMRSIELFEAVLETLPRKPERVPTFDPAGEVSFRLAATVEIDPRWKKDFLELRSEAQRLGRLDLVFQAAIDSGAALDIDREDL